MIALDAVSVGSVASTSLTYSHTCTGTNLVLIVSVFTTGISGRDSISGVTFNTVGMTLVDKQQNAAGDAYGYTFILVAPATGAHNVVVSASESATIRSDAISYTGAKQSGQPDSHGKKTTSGTPTITNAVTTNSPQCWMIVAASGHDIGAPQGQTNVTIRENSTGVISIGDSNGFIDPAQSFSQTLTVGGSNEIFNMLQVGIAAFQPTVTTNYLKYRPRNRLNLNPVSLG